MVILILLNILLSVLMAFTQDYGECVTPLSEPAKCVKLQDCQFLYETALRYPNLTEKIVFYLQQSQCVVRTVSDIIICCPDRLKNLSISDVRMNVTSTDIELPQPPVCGLGIENRIVGGEETTMTEFPWLVLIGYSNIATKQLKGYYCGGSLINTRFVVTASHCVNGQSIPFTLFLSEVRLGEWDTSMNPDCETLMNGKETCNPPILNIPVEKAIPHPDYDPRSQNQWNDIALLKLSKSIAYTETVKPICLPDPTIFQSNIYTDRVMDVSGWGETENKTGMNTIKMKATVTGWNVEKCKTAYNVFNINITDKQLCAGGETGVDSCNGDSGGPLMAQLENNGISFYYLGGIVSFGPSPCGIKGIPGVYTKASAYFDWIKNTIKSNV